MKRQLTFSVNRERMPCSNRYVKLLVEVADAGITFNEVAY